MSSEAEKAGCVLSRRYLLLVDRNFGFQRRERKYVFVRNDRGQIRCPSFIVIANGGTSAAAEPLTLGSVLTYEGEEGERKPERRGRGSKGGRRKDRCIDWIRDFPASLN